jgi:hypothetical protein
VTLEISGHFSYIETPTRFYSAVTDFLKGDHHQLALAIWIAWGYPLTHMARAKDLEQLEVRDGER